MAPLRYGSASEALLPHLQVRGRGGGARPPANLQRPDQKPLPLPRRCHLGAPHCACCCRKPRGVSSPAEGRGAPDLTRPHAIAQQQLGGQETPARRSCSAERAWSPGRTGRRMSFPAAPGLTRALCPQSPASPAPAAPVTHTGRWALGTGRLREAPRPQHLCWKQSICQEEAEASDLGPGRSRTLPSGRPGLPRPAAGPQLRGLGRSPHPGS